VGRAIWLAPRDRGQEGQTEEKDKKNLGKHCSLVSNQVPVTVNGERKDRQLSKDKERQDDARPRALEWKKLGARKGKGNNTILTFGIDMVGLYLFEVAIVWL
jgi:hypothetical protein